MTSEEWRPVVGFPGYEVSSYGRVLSRMKREPQILVGSLTTRGDYRKVLLRRDGKPLNRCVHVLVCEAFHGPRPLGLVTRHLDGDSLNNHAANLAWGTYSENARDRITHGTDNQARKTACIHGHPFIPTNTYVTPEGARRCRICHRTRDAESKARRALRAANVAA